MYTVKILSFRAHRSVQQWKLRSDCSLGTRMIKIFTVSIPSAQFCRHYSMVEPNNRKINSRQGRCARSRCRIWAVCFGDILNLYIVFLGNETAKCLFFSSPERKFRKSYCCHPGVGVRVGVSVGVRNGQCAAGELSCTRTGLVCFIL